MVDIALNAVGSQLLRRSGKTPKIDYENRLTQAIVGGVTSTSTYSGAGLRVSHTVNGVTTNYTWDVARRVPVVLQDGANTYVYGLNLISSTDASNNQIYYMYDGLGSTTNLVDGSGTSVASYSYDAFGAVRSQTGSSTNYWQFTGEQRDGDSGLDYLRARYYDPATGRFLSTDPLGVRNNYLYAANNPVNLVDPSGLCIPDYVLKGGCGADPTSPSDKEGGHFGPKPPPGPTTLPTGVPISGPAPCSSGPARSVCCHIGGSYENAEVLCGYLRMTEGGLIGVIGKAVTFLDDAEQVVWHAVTSRCAVGIVGASGIAVVVVGSVVTGLGLVEAGAVVTTSLGAVATSGSTVVALSINEGVTGNASQNLPRIVSAATQVSDCF